MNLQPCVVYEDDFLLIIDKPPGILVHPTTKEAGNTLNDWVQKYYQQQNLPYEAHAVSRLDRYTSGLVIFAKEGSLQSWLSQGYFEKEYLAVVENLPPAPSGIIDAPIARKEGSIIERCVDPAGKSSITEYRVLRESAKPLLLLKLQTGRTHQIRVHLAHLGCPIVGDHLYGKPGPQGRHLLHCWRISFQHPLSGEILTISRRPPEQFF